MNSEEERNDWTTSEVRDLIQERFDVEYTDRNVYKILRMLGMTHSKPYHSDYRWPEDAEECLKNVAAALEVLEVPVVGFFDETLPQTTANTVRVWSFEKSRNVENTSPYRANTFEFHTLNATSVPSFLERSRKVNVTDVLEEIREENPERDIMPFLHNFPSHTAKKTQARADELGVTLIFLPPYSPHLNPIELV